MAVLGLCYCASAFSSCGERAPLFIAVRGPLTVATSLVAEHRLQTHRLSSCGSRAQLLHGMWDLPRPGFEPVSPALAGRFSTTAPPGKPHISSLVKCLFKSLKTELVLYILLLSCESTLPSGCTFFIRQEICKYFLLVCGLSFHSLRVEKQ